MRGVVLILLVLLLGACVTETEPVEIDVVPVEPPASEPSSTSTGGQAEGAVPVLSVVDGDTIRVLYDGESEPVRLIGINAPERDECLYSEATLRLAELVGDEPVRLEADRSDRDQYGRLLRYVYVGDVFVNEALVREGLAISRRYEPDTAHQELLDAAQADAQAESVGMWGPAACGEAMGFASTDETAPIQIGHIRYDAEGDDNHNLNDEWVEFTNPTAEPFDLTGWSIKDESASHRYRFPDGFNLEGQGTVRLHTGCGADTSTELFWCNEGSAVWNNSGDTVFVLDPAGNIVTSVSYDG